MQIIQANAYILVIVGVLILGTTSNFNPNGLLIYKHQLQLNRDEHHPSTRSMIFRQFMMIVH